MGMNVIFFVINAHGVLRWMGAVTEILGIFVCDCEYTNEALLQNTLGYIHQ